MTDSVLTLINPYAESLAESFPEVDPGIKPLGYRILVQIRTPKRKSNGGIVLTTDTKDTEKWNQQVGKIIALGPVAFCSRTSLEPWPEGDWCKPGDYVRVPKYGGDRWEVPYGDGENAMFVIVNDLDIIGLVTGDPLAIRAFL